MKCTKCESMNLIQVESKVIHSQGYSNSYSSDIKQWECQDCGNIWDVDHVCYMCCSKIPGDDKVKCGYQYCKNNVGGYCKYLDFEEWPECDGDIGQCIPTDEEIIDDEVFELLGENEEIED